MTTLIIAAREAFALPALTRRDASILLLSLLVVVSALGADPLLRAFQPSAPALAIVALLVNTAVLGALRAFVSGSDS